ncbi:23616_t:CDS:2 [Racocetra persica]|uniref:23616_t:CDS:1 n=1 Tax=Racocetra persica TaxID=160502 RepID=A0ACA9LRR9_9GLOM|nr:23616_t:CDS:2 [Racocetra persica]
MKNNMIQTNCCELMEIFETAINRIEEMVNGILISNQEKTIEISTPMKVEAEKQMILVCKRGAECFSFLLADKLYKEDRFYKQEQKVKIIKKEWENGIVLKEELVKELYLPKIDLDWEEHKIKSITLQGDNLLIEYQDSKKETKPVSSSQELQKVKSHLGKIGKNNLSLSDLEQGSNPSNSPNKSSKLPLYIGLAVVGILVEEKEKGFAPDVEDFKLREENRKLKEKIKELMAKLDELLQKKEKKLDQEENSLSEKLNKNLERILKKHKSP